MSSATMEVSTLVPDTTMPSARILRAYVTEAKYESLRALRAPAFAIPFLLLPIALYVMFGVLLAGSMSHGDLNVARIMFVNWSVFGVMGPGMFGFGMFVATERDHGLLTLKRAMPMLPASYLLAKMVMTLVFSYIIMVTLIIAALALGHPQLSGGQYLAVAVANILGSLPFCAIGLFIGTCASAKSAPAFINLAYLPMMHLGGLFYPLPKSVQPIELLSPAHYLDRIALRIVGAPSLDELAAGHAGPQSLASTVVQIAVLAGITLFFATLAARRLKGLEIRRPTAKAQAN
jgi:ABC-2 type transport system permease protein